MPLTRLIETFNNKKGIGALIAALVSIVLLVYKSFQPADASCLQEVLYLQAENTAYRKELLDRIRENSTLRQKNKTTDSIYREKVINPAKEIINSQNHDH